jgi:hypothetical protein
MTKPLTQRFRDLYALGSMWRSGYGSFGLAWWSGLRGITSAT